MTYLGAKSYLQSIAGMLYRINNRISNPSSSTGNKEFKDSSGHFFNTDINNGLIHRKKEE
ncbi:hypothetical protein [Zunongwangia profunda]|jgi:hypothetical protein|uniref:hypothetical protein n=1 Tax=Zunongwangia profunda TaxID=398743 RepID=UPI001D1872AB|nr:hypothetical protein [Zunongwangia profunda]MCC4229532.1 hypothetical protein [Zunongwangia profunda]|tara:strand:+ start:282 stop:461 length:180 start_codon:yes stop_codon:yes gene_type:complete